MRAVERQSHQQIKFTLFRHDCVCWVVVGRMNSPSILLVVGAPLNLLEFVTEYLRYELSECV